MRNISRFFAAAVIAVTISACEVKQAREAEMPEVKVEGGQLPEVDVETMEVTSPAELEMAPSVEPESETTPAELEMAPSVEPESESS